MIIVEGCFKRDNRSLVQYLTSALPAMTRETDAPHPAGADDLLAYMSRVLGKCPKTTRRLVLNGFPLTSELAAGPVLRGTVMFSDDQIATIIDRLRLHDPLIVYCFRTPGQTEAIRAEAERMKCGVTEVLEILSRYDAILHENWVTRLVRHDLSLTERDLVVRVVVDYLNEPPRWVTGPSRATPCTLTPWWIPRR
ncbi:MAG: hypothetical protein ACM3X4_07905 [Ignavibacteriales bacterium]